jgi:hypothetical protein
VDLLWKCPRHRCRRAAGTLVALQGKTCDCSSAKPSCSSCSYGTLSQHSLNCLLPSGTQKHIVRASGWQRRVLFKSQLSCDWHCTPEENI